MIVGAGAGFCAMVSLSSISVQYSCSRYPSLREPNGIHASRSSISSVALARKAVKWKESRRGQHLKAIASNVMLVKECKGMKVMSSVGHFGATRPYKVEVSEENARRTYQIYSLFRSSRVYCEATTSGDFSSNAPSQKKQYERLIETLTNLFPAWVILGIIIGIFKPAMVTWLETDLYTLGLAFLMLSMGLTLKFEDFRRCLRNPWTVGVGFLVQYLFKPILGFSIAETLRLSGPVGTGFILVSCCPGGLASTVMTYISKGNVALSVLMNTCSTIGAIVMTPLLTKLLAGEVVPVDAAGLAISTFQVVLVPTIIGVLTNEFFPKFTSKIVTVTPVIGIILTTLLCASPIGQVSEALKIHGAGRLIFLEDLLCQIYFIMGVELIFPLAILHGAGFLLGYWISKMSFGESTSRTISIECGMQSSALGVLLAQKHFGYPAVALPSAVSIICIALVGSELAVFWRNRPIPADDKDDLKE